MKTPGIVRDIQFAVEGARSARPAAVDTLCCGTLGSIEFFCEAGSVLGRSDLEELALRRLTDVLTAAASSGDYRWNSGNGQFNLGLFRGLSGVGYTALRRVDKFSRQCTDLGVGRILAGERIASPRLDSSLPQDFADLPQSNRCGMFLAVKDVSRQRNNRCERVRSVTPGSRGVVLTLLVLGMLAGLPIAVWLDLRNLAENSLLRQAKDLNSVVSSVRGYYASNVVGRVLGSHGETKVVHNYESVPGAIPIPATLSIELGRVISEQQKNITYRFVSDFPFKNRTSHALDSFETRAPTELRDGQAQ